MNDKVELSCNTTLERDITWKFRGKDVTVEDDVQQNGTHLILSDVGANMLGEYSCWAEGQHLSSVYLLRKAEAEGKTFQFHFHTFSHSLTLNVRVSLYFLYE